MRTQVRIKLPPSASSQPSRAPRVTAPRKRPRKPTPQIPSTCDDGNPHSESSDVMSDVSRKQPQDEEKRLILIDKILHKSTKKGKDFRKIVKYAVRSRLDPPCIRYTSRREGAFLRVPSGISLHRLLNPREMAGRKPPGKCGCGEMGKYRDPETGGRFCSVECFRRLREVDS